MRTHTETEIRHSRKYKHCNIAIKLALQLFGRGKEHFQRLSTSLSWIQEAYALPNAKVQDMCRANDGACPKAKRKSKFERFAANSKACLIDLVCGRFIWGSVGGAGFWQQPSPEENSPKHPKPIYCCSGHTLAKELIYIGECCVQHA